MPVVSGSWFNDDRGESVRGEKRRGELHIIRNAYTDHTYFLAKKSRGFPANRAKFGWRIISDHAIVRLDISISRSCKYRRLYACVDRTHVAQLEFTLTNTDYGISTSIYIRSII